MLRFFACFLLGMFLTSVAPADRVRGQAMLKKALAGGLEAPEGGIATYDPTPGSMREIKFEAQINAGEIRRNTTITIMRLKPE